MNTPPIISVIMPCYNEADRIAHSIKNVFEQHFTNFELIIVDDGSSDRSLEILLHLSEKLSALKIFSQPNKGASSARNRGLKEAKGDFIAFLDADDSWHPDCLLKLHQKLESSPDAIIAYCGWQNIGLSENRCKPYIPPDYERLEKIETLLKGCPWPIHAALTRRSAIDSAQGFNEKLITSEDYDLWIRIASFKKISLVPEVLAYYHHHHREQLSKDRLRAALNHYRVQKIFLRDYPELINTLGRKKIRKIVLGELLHCAYLSYWARDLKTAHTLFRKVLLHFYFKLSDLKYFTLAILPYPIYQFFIQATDQWKTNKH